MDNLKFIKNDQQTRQITFQDTSGGYLGRIVTEASLSINNPFATGVDGLAKWSATTDPTVRQIADGKVFQVDSQKLGITTTQEGYLSYRDGVLDINYYVGFEQVTVTGNKGENWVTGTGMINYIEKYDSVLINGVPYEIDKSQPSNAGQVIYLFKPLTDNITSVTFAERSNLKLRNNFRTKVLICKSAHILGSDYRYKVNEKEQAVQKLIRNEMASKIFFEQEDYIKSEALLLENVKIGTYLNLIRGGQLCL